LEVPIWAAVLPILSVAVMAVSMALLFSSLKAAVITMSAGSQPLSALPDGVSAWNGWANRSAFTCGSCWPDEPCWQPAESLAARRGAAAG
jgi:hypothetical protein